MQPKENPNPERSKWGFYNNPDDPKIFIKTTDYGYKTMYGLNFAHKESYIITAILVSALLLIAYGKFFAPASHYQH
jgi:uncharacterized membrane protein